MRKHVVWMSVTGVIGVFAASVWGMTAWRTQHEAARRLNYADKLLTANRAVESLELLAAEEDPPSESLARRLGELKVEAYRKTGLTGQLRETYYASPELFDNNEQASLQVARIMLTTEDASTCQALCDQWRGSRTLDAQWFVLEVDKLIAAGDRENAIRMLESTEFSGRDDFPRLSRLAMLKADDPRRSWELLQAAYEKDSKNPLLRMFRGNLLEAAGKRAAARVEYVAAFVANPRDGVMCDQLAEFYRRCGNHRAAQQTWADINEAHTTDFIELKRNFWGRLAARRVGKSRSVPPGPWREFAEFLADLDETMFWDEDGFQKLTVSATLLKLRQEPFWLHLMQLLKDSDGGESQQLERIRDLLVESRVGSSRSYSHNLHRALTLMVNYKLQGDLNAPGVVRYEPDEVRPARHQFFEQLDAAHHAYTRELDAFTMPEPLRALAEDANCFAIIAMAAGWTEAAVRLDTNKPIQPTTPAWATYGMTQAYRFNRGVEAALQYASRQPGSPALSLLIGELHLANGDAEAAFSKLRPLTSSNDAVGMRAAWLIAMHHLSAGELSEAKRTVAAHSSLADSKLGRELLAKIALLRNDPAAAKRIYDTIGADSFEGTMLEARLAYQGEDWDQADRLTRKLMRQMPESMSLRANLRRIAKARGEHVP